MERLTYKLGEINPTYGLNDKASAKIGLFTDYDGFFAHLKANHKLGQYEDSGLTPEEVAELAKAKQDGRLAILSTPMKPMIMDNDPMGTDVFCPNCEYDLSGEWAESDDFEWVMYQCPNCGQSINPYQAITREEAEKALLKGWI